MIEVELKARVRDKAAVLAALSRFASPAGEIDKRDAYWHGPGWRVDRGSRGFRIRSERRLPPPAAAGGTPPEEGGALAAIVAQRVPGAASAAGGEAATAAAATVTFKEKRAEGGIEINREREFEVSDPEAFLEFIERLGCESFYSKRKRGLAFKVPRAAGEGATASQATIELVEVEGLGDFIEIEILLPSEEPAALALAQGEIRSLLRRSGLSEEDIESRYYSELLMEAGLVARP